MQLKLIKSEEYLAPVCKVYSINLEGVIAVSGEEVNPSPEDEWGTL